MHPPDFFCDEFLKSPQIGIVDAEFLEFDDCIVQVFGTGADMTCGARQTSRLFLQWKG